MNKKISTRQLVSMAMLGAISIVLVSAIHFPLIPAAAFLEYDPADIPIMICAFAYGPAAGFILTAVVSFIQGMTVSAQSGIIGIIMHIFATGCCVLVAGNIYKKHKTKKTIEVYTSRRKRLFSMQAIYQLFTYYYTITKKVFSRIFKN